MDIRHWILVGCVVLLAITNWLLNKENKQLIKRCDDLFQKVKARDIAIVQLHGKISKLRVKINSLYGEKTHN